VLRLPFELPTCPFLPRLAKYGGLTAQPCIHRIPDLCIIYVSSAAGMQSVPPLFRDAGSSIFGQVAGDKQAHRDEDTMRTADVEILMIPGWTGSGPDHWQTRWETRLKTSRRVHQDDWDTVDLAKWTTRLLEAVASAEMPVVLVAHSCGVPTVVHAAERMPKSAVIGAFLVCPPCEAACLAIPGMDPGFVPYPRVPLPFASLLIASRTDEHCPYEDAGDMALAWGSALVDAGDSGHLNTASGHGPWPEGVMQLGGFLRQLGPTDGM
jgi:uncharacterized protein